MGSHPLNLMVRFFLELAALFAVGLWGWQQFDGFLRLVAVVCLPLLTAVVWGMFAVPNDPSRSGHAPIPVPGFVRLVIELGIFATAALVLYAVGKRWESLAYALVTLLHYVTSYDRIQWLLKQ